MSADRAMPLPSTLAHPERDAWIRRELLERLYELDEEEDRDVEYAGTPIHDAIVLEHLARASRPSLWRRAGERLAGERAYRLVLLALAFGLAVLGISILVGGAS